MSDLVERRLSGLTVRIDRLRCIASKNCMRVAPEVFELDDEQVCAFKADPPDIERGRLIEACVVCPVGALVVLDEAGKQLVP